MEVKLATLAIPRRKTSLWSILALLAAPATGLAVYSYLSYVRSQIPIAGKLVPLVVAANDIDPGTVLEEKLVRVANHPEKYLPDGAISRPALVLGRVVTVPVFASEPITSRKLGAKGGISSVVPAGMRAYSLPVSSGLGVVPKPGDRLDVIVTLPREVLGEATTIIALRGREVASAGISDRSAFGKVGEQLGIEETEKRGLAVTLFVTPDEAQKLAMAESLGRITVVLAPAKPEDQGKSAPVHPGDLGSR
jgi:pilus assembly protein CpaB